MRRRAALSVVAIILMLFVTGGVSMALLARHVPAFYVRNVIPEGSDRREGCLEFVGISSAFWNALSGDRYSEHQFTQHLINSYFQEQEGENESSFRFVEIPDDIHDIRVALESNRIRLGFRFGSGWCSTVVTIDIRVWLVARKPNVIALELCGFRAGALPLGTQVLLDYVTEATRGLGIEVTWFRNQGHPVALLQLQANQVRPTFQIRRLDVSNSRLTVACSPTHEVDPSGPATSKASHSR